MVVTHFQARDIPHGFTYLVGFDSCDWTHNLAGTANFMGPIHSGKEECSSTIRMPSSFL